jgi:putative molybdopterin biosynthesis protein
VHRLQFHYTLSRDASPALVRNPLIDLLQAVAQSGSISAAARALKLSYRHVWGELKRWESELGHELIIWEKGQPARLTEFATKLMWAEAQAQARLAPQIDALRAELERTFAVAFDDSAHVVTLYASHDDALASLREYALHHQHHGHPAPAGPLHLDIRFTGSVDAIRALNEGRCVMAGFHTRANPPPGTLAERTYKPLLKPGLHKIIGFAQRSQGLMVAPGNPWQISSLQDVVDKGARFVNRPLGTGTRVLLADLMAQAALAPERLIGFERTEPSHTAVAQHIASGAADAGLGIEMAARTRGLDFVPLVQEHYHLVCLKSALDQPPIAALRQLLQSREWQQELATKAGYTPSRCGDVLSLNQTLPWWNFKAASSFPRRRE